ncbi:hypothetical protein KFE25_004372 [Diacronema lutheri]|uniref:SET domain-containing protein n=2 Tax=Diacronema lutheri TaxID=2081491 RepID=A0A8J5WZM2_DIALT|nr:hypothetical protein KFE25_004372 [Diacronema lutheri]
MGKCEPRGSVATAAPDALDAAAPVGAWLCKRGLPLPTRLRAAIADAAAARDEPSRASAARAAASHAEALGAGLRERDRRGLLRLVARAVDARRRPPAAADVAATAEGGWGAGGAGASSSSDDDADDRAALAVPCVRGGEWPARVRFAVDLEWPAGPDGAALRAQYEPRGPRVRKRRPCARVRVERIDEPAHPACGQCGLFAAVPLPCGARACDYVGTVRAPPPDGPPVACAPAAADKSDYELDFGAHSELSLDAHIVGNEGRFLNDFRNTGRPPNVEFRLRADRAGALRQGIFVSAKRGVEAGDELLVSYGKPYWRARVGSLDAFVTRRPAREAAG